MTSSVGRLFDAASALLGILHGAQLRGRGPSFWRRLWKPPGPETRGRAAAVEETAGVAGEDELAARKRYAVIVEKNTATETSTAQDTSVLLLDAEPTFHALLDDLSAGCRRPSSSPSLPRCHGWRHRHERRVGASHVRHFHGGVVGRRVHEPLTLWSTRWLTWPLLVSPSPSTAICLQRRLHQPGPSRGGFRSFRASGRLETSPTSLGEPATMGH